MDLDVDETAWPIVVVRWVGIPKDSTLTTFLDCMDRWLASGRRFGLLMDTRGGGGLSPEQRVRVIDHMKAHSELTARFYVQAMVITKRRAAHALLRRQRDLQESIPEQDLRRRRVGASVAGE